MTTKLELYNKAGGHLRQERLLDLTDDVVLKRELDAVYDATLQICLEEGLWKWSLRSIEISADPSIDTSDFGGFAYGFTLPTDFVRIANINADPYFRANSEVTDFEITGPGKTLYCDTDPFSSNMSRTAQPLAGPGVVAGILRGSGRRSPRRENCDARHQIVRRSQGVPCVRRPVDAASQDPRCRRRAHQGQADGAHGEGARAGGGRPKPNGPLWG